MVILEKPVVALNKAALERFVRKARRAAGLKGIANVLVTSSATVRSLNRRFRGKDQDTDVLSFPSQASAGSNGRRAKLAGEIAISADIAAKNAAQLGHSNAEEIKILALHGILHLAGFDHERDNGRMALREAELRQAFRLPSGLIERSQSGRRNSVMKKRGKRHRSGANAV